MRRITFVVFPGYSVMALAMVTAFESANEVLGQTAYEAAFISEVGGLVKTSSGLSMDTDPFDSAQGDTLIVGGASVPQPSTDALLDFLRLAPQQFRRIASTCTGAFALADAGLLNDRRATTHWLYARELKARFPKIRVDEDIIFINDGIFWTSAGMSAGIDLALALIETDFSPAVARTVARKLVVYHRRAGGQSQFSALLELEPKSDRIHSALAYARENLHRPLNVNQLAEAANLSPRQFSRAFHAETGQSPAKAVEHLRIEAARVMMEESMHPVNVVAEMTGFSDPDRMRRAFLRAFGQPPQVIRRTARLGSTDPIAERAAATA